ncbi:hypothetical protein QIS74_10968 [Colletotrichum tabaci]|uniref:Uncharacterized protein n=1 Tax=Colletotrichum tabaci TaxID=1209068 RepID=A0AAV9T206_9PEZI
MSSSNSTPRDAALSGDKRPWMHTIPRKPLSQTRITYTPVSNSLRYEEIDTQPDDAQGREYPTQQEPLFSYSRFADANDVTRAETFKTNDTGFNSWFKSPVAVSVSGDGDGDGDGDGVDKVIVDRKATWRPQWLRPAVLTLFVCFFVLFTAALAIMLHYSRRNNGLFQTGQSLVHVYVWRFGPTAIITILSVLWARVELQAMMYVPWFALRRQQPNGRVAMSIDYLSMLSPAVFIRSIRERHYLVSLVTIVSVVLKVQIILAPGLFSFATVKTPASVGVRLQDSFARVLDDEAVKQTDTSAWYMGRALRNFDMLYPFGVTDEIAYQTFAPMNGKPRGTIDEPVTAVVDGFFTDLDCLQLAGYSISNQLQENNKLDIYVDLHFQGCDGPISLRHAGAFLDPAKGNITYWAIKSNQTRACPGLRQDVPPFLYYSAVFVPTLANSSRIRFESAGAVLCEPRAWLSKVQVTDDGVAPRVALLQNQTRTPVLTNMWTLIEKSVPASQGQWGTEPTTTTYVKGPASAAKAFAGEVLQQGRKEDPTLYSNEAIYGSVMNLTRSLGPLLGHYRLRAKEDSAVVGSTLRSVDRLMTSFWYRNPATPLGNLVFLRDHPHVAAGIYSPAAESRSWVRCSFTPMVLRTWARLSFGLYALLLLGGLLLTLRLSTSSNGLATIEKEGYLHVTWTSLPALIALGVSLYISSCDWAYRDLGNLYRLSRKPCRSRELDVSLLDMMGLRALYHSIRLRLWSITCSQVLALVCGVLTSLASVLFTVEVMPKATTVQFQQKTVFRIRDDVEYSESYEIKQTEITTLLLQREANLTYPKNTFDDLVFPVFESMETLDTSRNLSVTINTPALKLQPSCLEVPREAYRLTFRNYTESGKTWFYSDYNEHTPCPSGDEVVNITAEFPLGEASLFGKAYAASDIRSIYNPANINFQCKLNDTSLKNYTTTLHYTYAWGEFSVARNDFDWFSVWRCNYTWAELDTQLNMIASDGEFVIDPENPPRPDYSSVRPLGSPLDLPPTERAPNGPFGMLPDIRISDKQSIGVASVFKPLVEPYGPLPKEALGDPDRVGEILGLLGHDVGFSVAQLANTENRRMIDDVLDTTSGALLLDATVVDRDRRRLVQDPNVTYFVVGILGAVILVNMWALASTVLRRRGSESWLLDMDVRGLAPDGWRSIASIAGLLCESNASAHLPPSTELLSQKELHGQMSDVSFRLGWFRRECDQTRHYTIGVMDDGEFNFMGVRRTVRREKTDSLTQERVDGWI